MEKNNKIRKYIKGYLFILPNFIGFFVFMALPIIMGLVISFTDYNGFSQFNFVGLKNYINMFHDEYFTVSMKNNLLYTLVTVPGTIVFALLLAVALPLIPLLTPTARSSANTMVPGTVTRV